MSDSTTNTAATTDVATGAGEKVVDVSVELARTLEAQLLARNYRGFLK